MKTCHCILLVDDDEISNFIHQRVIASANIAARTYISKNGKEALEFIREACADTGGKLRRPDVILLDIKMPIMDGFEFLQCFEKEKSTLEKDIKVILLTSSADATDVERARNHDISGYITKPLTTDKLNEVLAQL